MKTAALGSIASIVSGATPKTGVSEYWGGDVPWATPADISKLDGPFIAETPRMLTQAGLKSCSTSVLPPGSVLLSSRAPIGHVAINTVPMATNQGFKNLIPGPNADAKYLYHWLKSQTDLLQSLGNGATFKELSKGTTEQIQVPLPSIHEQRRIAAILDHADALRAKRRQVLTHFNALFSAVFTSLQHADTTRSRIRLSDAFWFQEGPGVRKWQFTDAGVKLLNVGNIGQGGALDLAKTSRYISDEEAAGKYAHFLVDAGDYVIASSGISFQPDGFLATRGAFVEDHHLPLCMNTSTIRFKAIPGLSTLSYLDGWLQSKEFRSQITRLVTGSAQQNFGPSHLRQVEITLPSIATQATLHHRLSVVGTARGSVIASSNSMDAFFSSLQSRAFRGEL